MTEKTTFIAAKRTQISTRRLSLGTVLGALTLMLAATTTPATAQVSGTPLLSPASFSYSPQGGNFTMGFAFTTNTATFLNALGAYDAGQDGFPNPMTVGLWSSTGTLLQQATVTSTDQLIGSFRYAALPSYALTAGTTYVVGAYRYSGDGGETYATGFGGTGAPGVSFVEARYNDSGAFAYPNNPVGTYGYFGANALIGDQVVVAPPVNGAVPEPATWAMMIGGFGAIGASMRRRHRTSVRLA